MDKGINDCQKWVIAFFAGKGTLPENLDNANYFDLGLIDSFGVLELIMAIEKDFEISLNDEHLRDRRFFTLSGGNKSLAFRTMEQHQHRQPLQICSAGSSSRVER